MTETYSILYSTNPKIAESNEIQGEGVKFDQGKPDWSLLPLKEVEKIVQVLTFGSTKYAPDNWKFISDPKNRYFAAMMRHLTAYQKGEALDPESGLSHLAHAGACLIFLLYYEEGVRYDSL